MTLTVAIPTYNRNEILRKNLAALLPQLNLNCELLIIDNCSDTPVANTINDLLQQYPKIRIRLVRNRVNIGGNANILRCFELSETEWLWILSDAYPPLPSSINTILKNIQENKDAIFINFRAPFNNRAVNTKTNGLQEFVEHIDNYGFVLMISSSVFNAKQLLPFLQYGYHFSYTLAPHIVLLLKKLSIGGKCSFRTEILVDRKVFCGVNTWSIINYPSILALREVGIPKQATKVLMKSIRNEFGFSFLVSYTRHSAQIAITRPSMRQLLKYNNRLFLFRYKYDNFSFLDRIFLFFVYVLLKYPKIVSLIYKISKKRNMLDFDIPDPRGY